MSLNKVSKKISNRFFVVYIFLFVLISCSNKNNYTEFSFISRYTNETFNIVTIDSVRHINKIIDKGAEVKDILKYPGFDYMMICKKDGKIKDTIFVSNYYLMYDKKCFKSKIGILDYLKNNLQTR
jgi:hypothetical protein